MKSLLYLALPILATSILFVFYSTSSMLEIFALPPKPDFEQQPPLSKPAPNLGDQNNPLGDVGPRSKSLPDTAVGGGNILYTCFKDPGQ